MASPGSYGSSHGSSFDSSFLGGQCYRIQQDLEIRIDRAWKFTFEQYKSNCRNEAAAFLDDRLWMLAKSLEPQENDAAIRQAAIERLRGLLPGIFPPPSQLRLVPYGSFVSSCYSRGSDLDLALAGVVDIAQLPSVPGMEILPVGTTVALDELEKEQRGRLLLRLADALEAQGVIRGSTTRILDARVPIIKFTEADSGIECDVCVTTRGCDFKGSIMQLLHGLQPMLRPLIRLTKLWARHHDINSAHFCTFNSWSLALMVLFSLQCHPDGHLLPPLWRLFYDDEPAGQEGAGRPLQDMSVPLQEMLDVATARCEEQADRLIHSRWSDSQPPPLLELMLWFLSCFATITGQWRDYPSHRNWRVSPWRGSGYVSRFSLEYVAAVEEPFDCKDNTARSLGTKKRHDNTLPYIAWVFSNSVNVLRNVRSVKDAARALTWLFGPDALPCVGVQLLAVGPSELPPELYEKVQKLANRAPGSKYGPGSGTGTAGAQNSVAGPPGAISAEAASEADEAEAEVQLVFRALISATKVGPPIMTLDEWRSQQQYHKPSRPPYTLPAPHVPPRHGVVDINHPGNHYYHYSNSINGQNHRFNLVPPPPPARQPHLHPYPPDEQVGPSPNPATPHIGEDQQLYMLQQQQVVQLQQQQLQQQLLLQRQQPQLHGTGSVPQASDSSSAAAADSQVVAELMRLLGLGGDGGSGGGGGGGGGSGAKAAANLPPPSSAMGRSTADAAARQAPYNLFDPARFPIHGQGPALEGQRLPRGALGGEQTGPQNSVSAGGQQSQSLLAATEALMASNGHAWPSASLFGPHAHYQTQTIPYSTSGSVPGLGPGGSDLSGGPVTNTATTSGGSFTSVPGSAAWATPATAVSASLGLAHAPTRVPPRPPPGFEGLASLGSLSQVSSSTRNGAGGGGGSSQGLSGTSTSGPIGLRFGGMALEDRI